MELWVKDKIRQLLALPETIEYINKNNFHLIYWDAEQYEADPEIVGNLTYTLLEAGLDPLKLDVKLKDTIPYVYLASTKTKTFSLPKAIKTIGGKAFERTSLDLFDCSANNQLENIDYHAFYACQKLKEVILPESLKYIGSECFRDCHHLEKINIPANCIFLGGGVLRTNDPVQSFDCTNKKYVDANTWYKHKVVLTLLLNLTPPWNSSTVQKQGIVIKGYYFSRSKERLTYDGSNYESLQLAYLNLLGKDFTTTYAYVGHYDPTSAAIVKDNIEGCIYGLFIGENDQYDANPLDPNSTHLGEHTFEIYVKCDQWDAISQNSGTGLVTGRFKLFDINTGRLTALYDSVVE